MRIGYIVKGGLGLFLFVIIGIFGCYEVIAWRTKGKLHERVETLPKVRTGLLLGTSPKLRDGRDNAYFVHRIQAAAELYKAGKVKYILVSEDNRRKYYNEPVKMKQALLKQAVPDSAIYLDYAGFRTLDSVVRAKEVFGQDSVMIISQRFHNERAIFLAEHFGLCAVGFNARDVSTHWGLKTRIREYLARVKVFVDLLTNKQPHFLGGQIKIGRK